MKPEARSATGRTARSMVASMPTAPASAEAAAQRAAAAAPSRAIRLHAVDMRGPLGGW
jgi:hypothetical protein